MKKYNLTKLANLRNSKNGVRLQPIHERLSAVKEYHSVLKRLLRGLVKEIKISVIPAYKIDKQLTMDSDDWFTSLRFRSEELKRQAYMDVESLIRKESNYHTESFIKEIQKTLKVDVGIILEHDDLNKLLSNVLEKNKSLIESLTNDTLKASQQIIYTAKIDGLSLAAVAILFSKQFKKLSNRAKIISSNEIVNFNSSLNKLRQTQAGVTHYEWSTSRDERVRERHRRLDGKVYKWGEPTGAEGGGAPGEPINCRCVPIAVIKR